MATINEGNKGKKTEVEILAEVMVKVIMNQPLTEDEKKLVAKHANKSTNVTQIIADSVKEKQAEVHSDAVREWFKGFKQTVQSMKLDDLPKSGDELKSTLTGLLAECPVLTKETKKRGSNGSGNAPDFSDVTKYKAGVYNSIIWNAVNNAGTSGIDKKDVVKAIETALTGQKVPAVGYAYRVGQALKHGMPITEKNGLLYANNNLIN